METEVCFGPPLFTPTPPPGLGGHCCGTQEPSRRGSPRLLLRAPRASLVCSSHQVTPALSQVQQTVGCNPVFKPPHVNGPKVAPSEGELRGNGWAKSPSSLSALLRSGTCNRWEPDRGQGREPAGQEQEGPGHRLLPQEGVEAGFLRPCLCLSLSLCHAIAPAAWKP